MPVHALVDLLLRDQKETVIYWWSFPSMECAYDDVAGSCEGQSVEGCKETCLRTPGCGGFSYPHGALKKVNCGHILPHTFKHHFVGNN